jgi:ADP-ribose pyrophosphatase YjhB (NUDIX family)
MREAARALILDDAENVLLVQFGLPGGNLWALPGGGLEEGESHADAVRRELAEEVGILPRVLDGPIWDRQVTDDPAFPVFAQHEFYFLCRDYETSAPLFSIEQLRAESIIATRWWSLNEIAASPNLFAPSRLTHLIEDLVAHGTPARPIKTGA